MSAYCGRWEGACAWRGAAFSFLALAERRAPPRLGWRAQAQPWPCALEGKAAHGSWLAQSEERQSLAGPYARNTSTASSTRLLLACIRMPRFHLSSRASYTVGLPWT